MSEIRHARPVVQKTAMPRKQERKYLDTLRDKACWGCGVQNDTVVPCHLNSIGMGHGISIKSRGAAFPGCSVCHDLIDRRGEYSKAQYDPVRYRIVYRVAQVALMELARKEIAG